MQEPRDERHGETRAGAINQEELGLVREYGAETTHQGLKCAEDAAHIGLTNLKMIYRY